MTSAEKSIRNHQSHGAHRTQMDAARIGTALGSSAVSRDAR